MLETSLLFFVYLNPWFSEARNYLTKQRKVIEIHYVNKLFNEPVVRKIDENYYHQLSYFSEILITVRNGRPSQMVETIKVN